MKKLIKDLIVGDKFYYCNWIYEVVEVLSEGQVLVKKGLDAACTASYFCLFSRTEEEVELVEKTKLKDLFVGARFKFTNPYADSAERTVLYKDDVAVLYVNNKRGDYTLAREGDLSGLLNEEVEVIPYAEEA